MEEKYCVLYLETVQAWIDNEVSEDEIRKRLEEAAQNGITFDGELIRFLCDEYEDAGKYCDVVDKFYDRFENSSRWSIGLNYIVRFCSENRYLFFEDVGLTEYQENEWITMAPYFAKRVQVKKWEWNYSRKEDIEDEANS